MYISGELPKLISLAFFFFLHLDYFQPSWGGKKGRQGMSYDVRVCESGFLQLGERDTFFFFQCELVVFER